MAKRPRLSSHLRLAASLPEQDERRLPHAPLREPALPAQEPLFAILDDAVAEMTRLTWLGIGKAWEVQLRLLQYWIGPGSSR